MSLFRSKTFFAAVILVLGGIAAANAQNSPGMVMRANVPTSFVVSGKMLPAGHYVIQRLSSSTKSSPNQLLITDRHGNSAMILGQAGEEGSGIAAHDAIVLRRVDGEYYLSQILYGGQFTGLTVPLPNAHKEYYGRNKASDRMVITMTTE